MRAATPADAALTPPELRRVGRSGLAVSAVGLGTNNFGRKLDLAGCRAVVHAALDHGITLFDTSDNYGDSETRLGELLQGHRDDVIIATKFGNDVRRRGQDNGADFASRASRRYVRRAIEGSLRRLRTDWIDLYQLHRPDPFTPFEETMSVLDDLVREGKVRYLGHSNLIGWQIAHVEWLARTRNLERFVSAQNRYSLLERGIEADIVPALVEYDIGLLPYFPLASGLLTGKYRRGQPAPAGSRLQVWDRQEEMTDRRFDVIEALETFAHERSITLLDVAIGGLGAQPAVASVIAGATSPEQVAANVAAGRWRPTPADRRVIDEITQNRN